MRLGTWLEDHQLLTVALSGDTLRETFVDNLCDTGIFSDTERSINVRNSLWVQSQAALEAEEPISKERPIILGTGRSTCQNRETTSAKKRTSSNDRRKFELTDTRYDEAIQSTDLWQRF